jgi:hypothetical protein
MCNGRLKKNDLSNEIEWPMMSLSASISKVDGIFDRDNGRTASTLLWDGFLSANYHALQIAVNRRYSSGLFINCPILCCSDLEL